MEHEDFEQYYWQEKGIWMTLCSCGKACWSFNPISAYEDWAQHEAND